MPIRYFFYVHSLIAPSIVFVNLSQLGVKSWGCGGMGEKLLKCSQCMFGLLFLVSAPPLVLILGWLGVTGAFN